MIADVTTRAGNIVYTAARADMEGTRVGNVEASDALVLTPDAFKKARKQFTSKAFHGTKTKCKNVTGMAEEVVQAVARHAYKKAAMTFDMKAKVVTKGAETAKVATKRIAKKDIKKKGKR